MKKILIILLLLITARAFAPDTERIPVIVPATINPYEEIMQAIIEIESAGDTLAFNPVEQACGPFQIRPIRLTDYNKRTGKNYLMRDCFKMSVSREVFTYYAAQIGPYGFERIARNWNGSGEMTNNYWKKVKALL